MHYVRQYKLSADLCYKLPPNLSLEEGALFEPLGVAVQAVAKVADLHPNKNVAIYGAGPVGLVCMAGMYFASPLPYSSSLDQSNVCTAYLRHTVAKALGSRRIIAIDVQKERLAFAKSYAATDIWESTPPQKDESKMAYAERQVKEMQEKLGIDAEEGENSIDVVIDCTGAEVCIASGIYLVKKAGTCVQVGMGADFVNIP